jgi:hypothetical protein
MLRDNQQVPASAARDEAAPSGQTAEDVAPARDETTIEGTAKEVAVAELQKGSTGPDDKQDGPAARTKISEPARAAAAPEDPDPDDRGESGDGAGTPRNARDGSVLSRDEAVVTQGAADGDRASAILVPPRAPDDPGVAPESEDESEVSLQRFRSAHIR